MLRVIAIAALLLAAVSATATGAQWKNAPTSIERARSVRFTTENRTPYDINIYMGKRVDTVTYRGTAPAFETTFGYVKKGSLLWVAGAAEDESGELIVWGPERIRFNRNQYRIFE